MFRVVADQLKLRGGLVRCGTCRAVFDAIGTLAYVEESSVKTIAAQPAGMPPKPAAAQAKPTAPAGPAKKAATINLRINPAPTHAAPAQRRAPAQRPAEVSSAETQRANPRPQAASAPFGQLGVPTLIFSPEAIDAAVFEQHRGLTVAAAQHNPATPQPANIPDQPATFAAAPTKPPAAQGRPDESIPPTAEAYESSDPAEGTSTDRSERDEPDAYETSIEEQPAFLIAAEKERRLSVFFTAGSAVLSIIVALQLAAVFRSELLAHWPALKPALVQLCRGFDCQVTWPKQAQALAVVGTELRSIEGTDAMELTAVIRNRAQHTVALPAIEVTLTDTQSRPVARKVFSPVDYLASAGQPSSHIDEGLPSGSDYTVRITFEARSLSASGFVVYPFYF